VAPKLARRRAPIVARHCRWVERRSLRRGQPQHRADGPTSAGRYPFLPPPPPSKATKLGEGTVVSWAAPRQQSIVRCLRAAGGKVESLRSPQCRAARAPA
jgi:hypothetical protein